MMNLLVKSDLPEACSTGETLCPESHKLSAQQKDMAILAVLALASLAIRIYAIRFFYVISTDGTTYALVAKQILKGNFSGIANSGFYPVLIAAAGLVVSDLELAGRIVSIILGTAVLIPLFLLGRELFSSKAALLACAVTVVHPSFVWFSCEVMTQSTYLTIQLAGILMVWRLFSRPSVTTGVLAGALLGLTYMTRPEGLLLFVALPFFPLLFALRQIRANWRPVAAYMATFALFFLLNIILVYLATGEWQISAKTDSALNDALSYYLNIPDLVYVPGYEPKNYFEILRDHPEFLPINMLNNLRVAWETMLPPWQWLLLLAGILSGWRLQEANRKKLFLLCTFSPLAVIILFYYIDTSYTLSYQPVMFLLMATAICRAETWLLAHFPRLAQQRLITVMPLSAILTLVYGILLFAPQIKKNIPDAEYWPFQDDGRRAEKHIGLLLKNTLPPGKVMTRWARIAFYADRDWMMIPAGVYLETIVQKAREEGVRFLIIDGLVYGNRPGITAEVCAPLNERKFPQGLTFVTDPANKVRGLQPYLVFKHPRSIGVVVYDLLG